MFHMTCHKSLTPTATEGRFSENPPYETPMNKSLGACIAKIIPRPQNDKIMYFKNLNLNHMLVWSGQVRSAAIKPKRKKTFKIITRNKPTQRQTEIRTLRIPD